MLLRVGSCEIDCERRRILRGGDEQPLTPKAFDLLVVLVDERPKVVSKDALIKKLWPETFVADANLAILIGDVRAALGDSARKPRIIRTHHRVGYSFVGEVTDVVSGAPASDQQPSFVLVGGKRRILLYDGTVMIGRDRSCAIVIDHPSVSRFHARLTVDGERLTVEDNHSKNGTRIDTKKSRDAGVVRSGQTLTFGSVEMTVLGKNAFAGSTITAPDE